MKFAQNLDRKLLKTVFCKKLAVKNYFGPWPLAAHGHFARVAHCAADKRRRLPYGMAKTRPMACQTTRLSPLSIG
jgi:hypothetical protein